MQNDLINRKDVEKVIDELELYTVGRLKKQNVYITVAELQNLIDSLKSIPTAYDEEKVIAELEEIERKTFRMSPKDAIDIVRNGRKE